MSGFSKAKQSTVYKPYDNCMWAFVIDNRPISTHYEKFKIYICHFRQIMVERCDMFIDNTLQLHK